MEVPEINYDKLKGKIKEILGTQAKLAERLNVDETTISNKLNNNTYFTQKEILKICSILEINIKDVSEYFFKQKVRENELNCGPIQK